MIDLPLIDVAYLVFSIIFLFVNKLNLPSMSKKRGKPLIILTMYLWGKIYFFPYIISSYVYVYCNCISSFIEKQSFILQTDLIYKTRLLGCYRTTHVLQESMYTGLLINEVITFAIWFSNKSEYGIWIMQISSLLSTYVSSEVKCFLDPSVPNRVTFIMIMIIPIS